MTQTNEIVIVAQIILVPYTVNVYHQTLVIQLKSLLATINTGTNTLASVKQNSKPGQVTIKIHLKTDKKKKTLNFKVSCQNILYKHNFRVFFFFFDVYIHLLLTKMASDYFKTIYLDFIFMLHYGQRITQVCFN